MNMYNNKYSRPPGADPANRFNKRQRYAANSGGVNNSPRYKYQNQPPYQYSPNRLSASDNFPYNRYETNSNRFFYSNSPKRSNYSQQQSNKQPTSYSHKAMSSSPSTFHTSTQNNNLSPQHDRLPAKKAATTVTGAINQQKKSNIAQNTSCYDGDRLLAKLAAVKAKAANNQQQQQFNSNVVENSNYYGCDRVPNKNAATNVTSPNNQQPFTSNVVQNTNYYGDDRLPAKKVASKTTSPSKQQPYTSNVADNTNYYDCDNVPAKTADAKEDTSPKQQQPFTSNAVENTNYYSGDKSPAKTAASKVSPPNKQPPFTSNVEENTNYYSGDRLPAKTADAKATSSPKKQHPFSSNIVENTNYYGCDRLAAKTADTTVTSPNNQQPFTSNIVQNTGGYYGFPFNFYPSTYNADLIPTASSLAFGAGVDGISPYMWQTITSRPPPQLPQQQQPPLPLQQPPALPPLPSPEMSERSHLPPPPTIPSSIIDSVSTEYLEPNNSSKQDSGTNTIVKMKAKRKAMSTRYKLSKLWSRKDAMLALKAEEENARKLQKDFILIIRFPDPEISRELVKSYSPDIESVHFQLNFAPRYCFIHLKPGTDVEKTIDHISKIPFGTGTLSVEIKQMPFKTHSTKLSEIDPFTLYVGNLPTTIACKTLKEHFPGAARIDIGFAHRMKYTRYAFVRYRSVCMAIEAYKRMLDVEIGGRTLTIRFRRLPTANEANKEGDADPQNNEELHDDLISPLLDKEPENSVNEMAQTVGNDVVTVASSVHTTAANYDVGKDVNNTKNDEPPQPERISLEDNSTQSNDPAASPLLNNLKHTSMIDNLTQSNECMASPAIASIVDETITQPNSRASLLNIKPDPDVDPSDIVIRPNAAENSSERNENAIKQEQENLALYAEFFERPQTQTDGGTNSNRSNRNSLTSTTDDTDTMSQLSSNSLGEFLQSCARSQKRQNTEVQDAEPPAKRNRVTIKSEPVEMDNAANKNNSISSSDDVAGMGCVKQEAEESFGKSNTSVGGDKVISSRKISSNTQTCVDSPNDDIVPNTALFFTTDYHKKWTRSSNNYNNEEFYNEFYEIRTSPQISSSQTEVKTEPFDAIVNSRTNGKNRKSTEAKPPKPNSSATTNNICTEKSKLLLTTTSKVVDDDDDLVPAQNLLGSYRPHQNVVKQETAYDDLFAVPFSKCSASNTGSTTNSTSGITQCANITKFSKTQAAENNDDDVVIVSANIPPASKQKPSNNSFYQNLIIPRLTDLVSFNYKPISASTAATTLLIRDHLDELYDQLNADSDSEL